MVYDVNHYYPCCLSSAAGSAAPNSPRTASHFVMRLCIPLCTVLSSFGLLFIRVLITLTHLKQVVLNIGNAAVVEVNIVSLNMEICCDFLTIDGKKYVPLCVPQIQMHLIFHFSFFFQVLWWELIWCDWVNFVEANFSLLPGSPFDHSFVEYVRVVNKARSDWVQLYPRFS